MNSNSDRNLLIGILSFQMEFIQRDQLIEALSLWVSDKTKTLDHVMVEKGVIDEPTRQIVIAVVDKHLEKHGHDAEASIASLTLLDTQLRTELSSLVTHDSLLSTDRKAPDSQLDHSDINGPELDTTKTLGNQDEQLDRYQKLRPHASGGLGEVFVALDRELNREVALKEIRKDSSDSRERRDRFLMEAEITGCLEHPGIVPVYGMGIYHNGRPYYAMKLVRGESLKRSVDRFLKSNTGTDRYRSLEFRGLLRRFVDVCQAVGYAHERGIIHRDIKPSNIMLGRFGETLVVDWGLAKPIDADATRDESSQPRLLPRTKSNVSETIDGHAIGTPAFMSPEQASGRSNQASETSDLYNLGATLFYMLTGQPPCFDDDTGEILRQVESGDFDSAHSRVSDVPKPLDAICMKALALKPEDRYASTGELADEIERWLADETVQAYPEPLSVRAWRWVGKHRSQVASITLAGLVALISAVVLIGVVTRDNQSLVDLNRELETLNQDLTASNQELEEQSIALMQAETAARSERDEKEILWSFFVDGFVENLSTSDFGRSSFRIAIVESFGSISDIAPLQPLAAAELRSAFGKLLLAVSEISAAEEQLLMAIEIFEEHGVPDSQELLTAKNNLAELMRRTGRDSESLALLEEVLEIRTDRYGEHHDSTLATRANIASARLDLGEVEHSISEFREIVRIRSEDSSIGPTHRKTISMQNNLAFALIQIRKYGEAAEVLQQAIDAFASSELDDGLLLVNLRNNYGTALHYQDRPDLAVAQYESALDIARDELRPGDPVVFNVRSNYIESLHLIGRSKESLEQRMRLVEEFEESESIELGSRIIGEHNLGSSLLTLGNAEMCLPYVSQSVSTFRDLGIPLTNANLRLMSYHLADAYLHLEQFDQAERVLDELIEAGVAAGLTYELNDHALRRLLAKVYEQTGRLDEAEMLLVQLANDAEVRLESISTKLNDQRLLAELYVRTNRLDEAAELLDSIQQLRVDTVLQYGHLEYDQVLDQEARVEWLIADDQLDEAASMLADAIEKLERLDLTRIRYSLSLCQLKARLAQIKSQQDVPLDAIDIYHDALELYLGLGYQDERHLAELRMELAENYLVAEQATEALIVIQDVVIENRAHTLELDDAIFELLHRAVIDIAESDTTQH